MSDNPFEPPEIHDELTQKPRRRTWVLFAGVPLIFIGWCAFVFVDSNRIEVSRIRQREAAEQAQRAKEAATKAKSPREFTVEDFGWPAAPKTDKPIGRP